MSTEQEQGRISRVTELGVEVEFDTPARPSVFVRFDNFGDEQPPPIGTTVSVYWAGWRFGATSDSFWSLEAPAVVNVEPLGVRLYGFRSGRKRHLKFLVHEVGLNRQNFADMPASQSASHPASLAAHRFQEAARNTGCPGADHGQAACNDDHGVQSCRRSEFWDFNRLLAGPARRYEAAVLAVARTQENLACLMIGPPEPTTQLKMEESDELQTAARQVRSFMFVASPRSGIFIEAAAPTSNEQRYSLLTAYIPDRNDPVSKLHRRLEGAEHISRIHGDVSLRNLANLLEVKAAILATRRTEVLRAPRRDPKE